MDSWRDILISWANILEISDPADNFVGLYPKFIFRCCEFLTENRSLTFSCLEDVESFLNERYPRVSFTSAVDEEDKLTMVMSLLLIHCSLHCGDNNLREKPCGLPIENQTFIKNFLERFIHAEIDSVTSESIKFNILMTMRRDLHQTVWTTPTSTSHHSTPASRKSSSRKKSHRIQRLRQRIQVLETTQSDLQEENDNIKETLKEMEHKLDQKNREIERLKDNINSLSCSTTVVVETSPCAKCQSYERKLSREEEENQRLHGELLVHQSDKESLENKLKRSEDLAKTLKYELAESACAIEVLNKENKLVENANKTLLDQIKELEETIQASRRRSQSPDSTYPVTGNTLAEEVLDVKLQEITNDCAEKDAEITRLLLEVGQLKSSIDGLRLEMVNKEMSIAALGELIGMKDNKLAEQSENIDKLKHDIAQELEAKIQLQCQVVHLNESYESKVSDLTTSLECEIHEKKSLVSKLEDNRQELYNVKCQLAAAVESLDTKKFSVVQLEELVADLRSQIVKLQLSESVLVSELNRKEDELTDASKNLEVEMTNREKAVTELNELIRRKDIELADLSECIVNLKHDIAQEQEEKIQLQQDLVSLNKTHESEVSELKKSLECEIREKTSLISTLENNCRELQNVRSQLAATNESLNAEKSSVIQLEELVASLRSQIVNVQTSVSGLENELHRKKEELTDASKKLEVEMTNKQMVLTELNELIRGKDIELAEQSKCIVNLKRDIAQEREEKLQLHQQLVHVNKSHESEVSELTKSLELELTDKKGLFSTLEDSRHELQKVKRQLESTIESLNVEKSSVIQLEELVADQRSQMVKVQTSVSALESEMQRKRDELADVSKKLEVEMTNREKAITELNELIRMKDTELAEQSKCIVNLKHDIAQELEEKIQLQQELVYSNTSRESEVCELMKSLEFELTDKKGLVSTLEGTRHELQNVKSQLASTIELLNAEKSSVVQLEELVADLRCQIINVQTSESALVSELHSKQDELTDASKKLEVEMTNKQMVITELNELIRRKDTELAEQSECIANLKRCIAQELEEKVQLQQQVLDLNENHESEVRELSKSLEFELNEKKGVVSTLEVTRHELQNVKSQLASTNESLNTKKSSVIQLEGLVADLRSQIVKFQTSESALLSELTDASKKLEVEMTNKEKAITELNQSIRRKDIELAEQSEHIVNLKHDIAQELEEKVQLHQQLLCLNKKHESDVSELKKSLECEIHEKKSLVSTLEDNRRELQNVRSQLAAANESLNTTKTSVIQLEELVASLRSQEVKLQASESVLVSELRDKSSKLEVATKKIETIERELLVKGETLLSLSKNFEEMSSKYFDETRNQLETVQDLRKQIESKTGEIQRLEDVVAEETSQLESLRVENITLNHALQQSCQRLDEISLLNRNLLKENTDLLDEARASRNRQIDLNTEIQSLRSKITENQSSTDLLNKEIEHLTSTVRNAEEEVQALQNSESQLRCQIHCLEAERNELSKLFEIKSQDNIKYAEEIQIVQASLKSNLELTKKLQDEVESNLMKYREETSRLSDENKNLRAYLADMEADQVKSCRLRKEYDKKLEELAEKAKRVYLDKVKELKIKVADELAVMRNDLIKEKEARLKSETQAKELSDRLLIVQEEKRSIVEAHEFQRPQSRPVGAISNPAFRDSPPLFRTHSMDNLPSRGLDNYGVDFGALDDSVTSRRASIRGSGLPKGIGKVFPAAEEEGEVFDSRCLADLKAGICNVPGTSEDRMSILQKRNSMCPPHLRSSYPVETQFLDPRKLKEDDLRNPANSRAQTTTHLPSKPDPKKKNKIQASYKKPGPPTPVKNASQQSSKAETERGFVLMETTNTPRRGTPSRIRALFQSHKKDQNTPPNRRRL